MKSVHVPVTNNEDVYPLLCIEQTSRRLNMPYNCFCTSVGIKVCYFQWQKIDDMLVTSFIRNAITAWAWLPWVTPNKDLFLCYRNEYRNIKAMVAYDLVHLPRTDDYIYRLAISLLFCILRAMNGSYQIEKESRQCNDSSHLAYRWLSVGIKVVPLKKRHSHAFEGYGHEFVFW